jgi:hypothetical protein
VLNKENGVAVEADTVCEKHSIYRCCDIENTIDDEECSLQSLVAKFDTLCEWDKLVVNIGNNKIMIVTRGAKVKDRNIAFNGIRMEKVCRFGFKGVARGRDGMQI